MYAGKAGQEMTWTNRIDGGRQLAVTDQLAEWAALADAPFESAVSTQQRLQRALSGSVDFIGELFHTYSKRMQRDITNAEVAKLILATEKDCITDDNNKLLSAIAIRGNEALIEQRKITDWYAALQNGRKR